MNRRSIAYVCLIALAVSALAPASSCEFLPARSVFPDVAVIFASSTIYPCCFRVRISITPFSLTFTDRNSSLRDPTALRSG
jgi:hypothetical protein